MEVLGERRTPDGALLALTRRGEEYIILADGKPLRSSRMHGSEEALATLACAPATTLDEPCVLVGRLGIVFTLLATRALLPPAATFAAATLRPALVPINLRTPRSPRP